MKTYFRTAAIFVAIMWVALAPAIWTRAQTSFPSVNATTLAGTPVSATAPTTNQVLAYNGSAWAPTGTPALGAATATSLVVSGIMDGTIPVTVEGGSSTPCPTGTHCAIGGTYSSGYYVLQPTTAGSENFLNLPATAVGKQYCVVNSTTGSAPVTGIISITVPTSSYFIFNGTIGTVSSTFTSAGAAGDAACFVAHDATHWTAYVQSGTWTAN